MFSHEFEIIDCHVHPAGHQAEHYGWFLPFESAETFVASLKNSGISRACGSCILKNPGNSFSAVLESNRKTMEFCRQFPDFIIPGIQIDPRWPDESCRELERLRREGVRWVGELVGYIFGYGEDYDAEGAFQVYDLARRLNMIINFHHTDHGRIARMCESFPDLPFVIAHPGNEAEIIRERAEILARYPNLYLDISGSGISRRGALRHYVDTAGAEKILFGTDFPICTAESYIACVLAEPISDSDRAAIFSGNFKRLTGIT